MELKLAAIAMVLMVGTTSVTAGGGGEGVCGDDPNVVWNPIGSVCFKLLPAEGNQKWEAAKDLCNGELAILPLNGEVEWFENLRRTNDVWKNAGDLWLGGMRKDSTGWEWISAAKTRAMNFADWGGTEPNIKKANKDYCTISHAEEAVKTSAPYHWSAKLCSKKAGVVCEYKPVSIEE